MINHIFTERIRRILKRNFPKQNEELFERSELLQYLNIKTKSANKGSKARSSFANLYAIYVLVEDYRENGYDRKSGYSNYEGAEFTKLFSRQRELPFGRKLQNHALNNRMNSEFQKYFPNSEFIPILRNLETNRYWINENLLKVKVKKDTFNLAKSIIEIIDDYMLVKKESFERFIKDCIKIQKIEKANSIKAKQFVNELIKPNVDARLFEIVSFSILKSFYKNQKIYWGFEKTKIKEDYLILFKTGRTNANDGGIDFVMKPLGRFFQVTETLDVKKYFLDIDKIERYPITFVIKSELTEKEILSQLRSNALKKFSVKAVVDKYMNSIEEVINIPSLMERFNDVVNKGHLNEILKEIIKHSKVEFNYQEG
jgi:hypothetical protein